MGIDAEHAPRDRAAPPAGRVRRDLLRRRAVRWMLAAAVLIGLWLSVASEEAIARWAQVALGAIAVAAAAASPRWSASAVPLSGAATAAAWLAGLTADPFVLTGFAVFRLAEARGRQRFPWWLLLGALVVAVVALLLGADGAEERFRTVLLSTVVLAGAWALGVRSREAEAAAAEQSRAQERLHLARDVHDVLSHSLGAIGVRAGVAAHVPTVREEQLRETLRGIEEDARSSLSELRDLIARVRADSDASSPLSAALASVVRAAERTGVAVQLDADPAALDDLPAGVGTTVLRTVQESVTNALRHAAASSIGVQVVTTPDAVAVRVLDDGRGVSGAIRAGHGLIGLRERAELLGGSASFASAPSGFTVSVVLPRSAGPASGGRR
ncbi:sensor histidine kinase [Arenivirga flava]|uniref:histidine kinase n=1 Tax=Arenivirga flava TaxID=1930060 RepID=A0AA37UGK6_9MICO|nr:histidine kinase [Arenivirga flava]GMA27641.1 hypothetical protein GCM10025874_08940 [Arenivirga flava]